MRDLERLTGVSVSNRFESVTGMKISSTLIEPVRYFFKQAISVYKKIQSYLSHLPFHVSNLNICVLKVQKCFRNNKEDG